MKAERKVYISSDDRVGFPAGDTFDFHIDLENSIRQMGQEFEVRDRHVKVTLAVTQLFVPFEKDAVGFIPRVPPYFKGSSSNNTRHVPQVEMLRLHTDLVHNNMTHRGHSDTILQIPFMEHYRDADPRNERTFSYVTYKEQTDNALGRVELVHGLHSLNSVRFWITDEGDRFLKPKFRGRIHIELSLQAETGVPDKTHKQELVNTLRHILHVNRLLLVQGDSRRALVEHLKRHTDRRERREDSSGRSDRKRTRAHDPFE